MEPHIFDNFVNGLYELSKGEFSNSDYKEAKRCLLDYLGVTFAGAYEIKEKSIHALENFEDKGSLKIIGLSANTSIQTAILFNGIHAHVIELDDGHRYAMMHPGAPILSALIPLAQQKKCSGESILRGILLGYESSIRLASALQPSLKKKGFHGTGIAGTVGVAVAIATMLNFDFQQFKDAVSAATTSAAGILKVIRNISELKPYNVGNAAQSGYNAALLAMSGFKGPYETFEGDLGFLKMMGNEIHYEFLNFQNKQSLAIHNIYRKPYAACRHCHAPIEASLILKENYPIEINNIDSILVKTYSLGVAGHEHTFIEGRNSAKMSTPYSVAVALIKGKANLEEFDENAIADSEILGLTRKVEVMAADELSALVPEKRVAIVEIKMKSNELYSQRIDYPKGEPENPITEKELQQKFYALAMYSGKSEKDCENIVHIVDDIEEDFDKLWEYL